MYEDTTYEIILERMLRNVKENSPELDTRDRKSVV